MLSFNFATAGRIAFGAGRSAKLAEAVADLGKRPFICTGSEQGARYGRNGMGTGRMPGFCVVPAIDAHTDANEVSVTPREAGTAEDGAMMTQDQVVAIVQYVRSLNR